MLRPLGDGSAGPGAGDLPSYDPDEIDEATGEEAEAVEEQILDEATAAIDPRRAEGRNRAS